jgi:hypothetical protein
MKNTIVAVVLIGGLALNATARADDGFTIRPYAWLSGMTGDVGARGVKTSLDESFVDILDASDSVIGFFGRGDLRKGRLGFYVEGGYMRLGVDNVSTPIGEADDKFDLGLVDAAILVRVLETPSDGRAGGISIDALAGARYVHLQNDFDFDLAASRTQTRDWVDPIVGAEATINLNEQWALMFHGDVGGFGVASDLTWSAAGLVSYRFNLGSVRSSVFAGYKAIGEDYSHGSGINEFTWDTVLHGPVIGLSFMF